MDSKTASHLNTLLDAASKVIYIYDTFVSMTGSSDVIRLGVLKCGSPSNFEEFLDKFRPSIEAAAKAAYEAAIVREIRSAASERREACSDTANCIELAIPLFIHNSRPYPGFYFSRVVIDIVREMKKFASPLIEAFNRCNSEAYEAYRLACEQGVAVPPPEA